MSEVDFSLDRDYFQFISLVPKSYGKITGEDEKKLCDSWLEKIFGEKVENVSAKRNRNTWIMYLLMAMDDGSLTGVFETTPGSGPLPSSKLLFNDVSNLGDDSDNDDDNEDADEVIDSSEEVAEERMGDAKTYVSVRNLPGNGGMYAFVSLSLDKDYLSKLEINPCTTDKSKLMHLRALERLHDGGKYRRRPQSEREMEDFYQCNVETKISGDLSKMWKDLADSSRPQCSGINETTDFFGALLSEIDKEIRGEAGHDHKLVKFLISRLSTDLKSDPDKSFIMDLPPSRRNLKILEILRQKLILRQQEYKQRYLLAEMENRISGPQFPRVCPEDAQSDFMWKLEVKKPLKEDKMKKLRKVYNDQTISAFLELLSKDRQQILQNGLVRQRKLIESLQSCVYKDVRRNKAAYNKARLSYREWNEILSNVEEIMYEIGSQRIENDAEGHGDKDDSLLKDMMSHIREIESMIVEEAKRADELTSRIGDVNSWTLSQEDNNCKNWSWELKAETDNLKEKIGKYQSLIEKQTQKIEQLKKQISLSGRK